MTNRLREIGTVLTSIDQAVKASNELHQKNSKLRATVEQTKKQAENVEELNIADEPLLHELKQIVREVRDHGSKLEIWMLNFRKETESVERFVKTKLFQKVVGVSIPAEVMREFCDALQRMHGMATGFSVAFEEFVKHLSKAQETAAKLTGKLKEKEADKTKQADSRRNKGAAETVGLVAAGIGLLALGFFTGGAAWVAAGAVAGAACGVGATAVGVTTASSVKQLRETAGDILKNANKLDGIAKNLRAISDRAGGIQLDSQAIESLKTVLEFFNEKDKTIAQQNEKIAEKDEEIERLRAELQSRRL